MTENRINTFYIPIFLSVLTLQTNTIAAEFVPAKLSEAADNLISEKIKPQNPG
ncbi:MAG: hypothetical protein GY808_03360 [Gammaproteobacteria bacterium]|nr:hypothetical protein [Gammaproteobacteria bacterium]